MTSKVSTKGRDDTGFTLVEVLVASGAAAFVILGALAFLVTHARDYSNQHQIRDTQQEVRFGVDSLVRDLRMAGYGLNVPASQLPLWLKRIGGSATNLHVLAGAGPGGSDAVQIAGAFGNSSASLAEAAVQGGTKVTLGAGQGQQFDAARRQVICIGGVEAARVVSRVGDVLTVSTHPTRDRALTRHYARGTPVELVEALTYALRVDTNALADTRPFLARIRQCVTNQNVMDHVVAAGIEELRLTPNGDGIAVELAGGTATPLRRRSGPGTNEQHRWVRVRTFVLPRNSRAALE